MTPVDGRSPPSAVTSNEITLDPAIVPLLKRDCNPLKEAVTASLSVWSWLTAEVADTDPWERVEVVTLAIDVDKEAVCNWTK